MSSLYKSIAYARNCRTRVRHPKAHELIEITKSICDKLINLPIDASIKLMIIDERLFNNREYIFNFEDFHAAQLIAENTITNLYNEDVIINLFDG